MLSEKFEVCPLSRPPASPCKTNENPLHAVVSYALCVLPPARQQRPPSATMIDRPRRPGEGAASEARPTNPSLLRNSRKDFIKAQNPRFNTLRIKIVPYRRSCLLRTTPIRREVVNYHLKVKSISKFPKKCQVKT